MDDATREAEGTTAAAAGTEGGDAGGGARGGVTLPRLRERLDELRGRLDLDPFANPIRLLSLDLLGRMGPNGLGDGELEALIQRLTLVAFRSRAEALSTYAGENDPAINEARVAEMLRAQAVDPQGGDPVPFEAYAERVGRVAYGFVVTAHPTFGLAPELQDLLAALAFGEDGRPLSDAARRRVEQAAERLPHRPPRPLDLAAEHQQAMRVVRNLRAAIRRVRGVALDVARELYPDRWRELRPGLLGVASWVGYDTDGRSDIAWGTTIAKRLAVQVDQLAAYREQVAGLRRAAAAGEPGLVTLLELLEARLSLGLKSAADERELFAAGAGGGEPGWAERVAKASREMAAAGSARLAGAAQLLELVERALAATRDDGIARELCLLRAEVEAQGLTSARTHVRINAIQLQNAIRKTIGMDHAADDPAHRLTYLEAVARLADEVERPLTVNFGSLAAERTTAKRALMIMAQMLKHFDASEPVRFLIAECESPFTLLTALYFARLFGIAERVDISPLFETRKALERGASIVAEALSVASYRDYVRARGRICIQTGFSDAGRYMGQTAAAVMIERIRLDLARVLADNGLADLELVIFDTHGESIGRGAHPGGFADRLRYYDTPESRRRLRAAGVRLKEESSYQGGDGYLFFLNPTGAFAAVTRVLEHVLAPNEAEEADDPFYHRRSYVDEFFAAVAKFNGTVIDNPDYAAFLGFLGADLLYQTGSRPLKRQHDAGGGRPSVEHPSQLRAIPHNAILQQLGILANTIGGVGGAVDKDPDGFRALYLESPRFRRLLSMVEHAFKFTDLDVVKAYIDLFDPEAWLRRAESAKGDGVAQQEDLRAVADQVERIDLHDRLARVFRVFHRDHMDLARALREHRRLARDAGRRPIAIDPETRDNIHALHALRLALMQRLMLRAVHVPDFSDRHAATRDAVVARLMRLDVLPALEILAGIFPLSEDAGPELDYGEPATYEGGEGQSYLFEHETVFRPIARDHELIRRIGSGIVHHIGAVG